MKTLLKHCEFIVDCEHKTAPVQEDGYPSIRTPNIGRGYFLLDGVNRVSEQTYAEWTRRAAPRGGDLILAREAPVGNVAVILEGEEYCLGQRTVLIRPDRNQVNSDYLCYLLLTPQMQGLLMGKAGGATVHHLNMKDIRALPIPMLPSLDEQEATAKAIKNYDDLIATNQRRIGLLEEAAHRLYREWFVHLHFPSHESELVIGDVPDGWRRVKLSALCEEVRDAIDPTEVSADTPYLSMEHMPQKSITLGTWDYAGKVGSTKLQFRQGDVLFGKIRPYFHKVGLTPIAGITSTDVIVVRPQKDELRALVLMVMSSDSFVQHAVATSNGTKMPRANWKVLRQWAVLIPGDVLLGRFNTLVGPMLDQIAALTFQNRALAQARDALLPKLMSGQLDVSGIPVPEQEAA